MSRILLVFLGLVTLSVALPLDWAPEFAVQVPVEESPESSLNGPTPDVILLRVKRQFGPGRRGGGFGGHRGGGFGGPGRYAGGYPQGGFGGPGGFQTPSFSSSAANAQAQGFNAGNFGANAANAATQGFSFGPGGFQGSAGQSFSQNYRFPGLGDISVSGAQTFGVGPSGVTRGGSQAVTLNGRPFNG